MSRVHWGSKSFSLDCSRCASTVWAGVIHEWRHPGPLRFWGSETNGCALRVHGNLTAKWCPRKCHAQRTKWTACHAVSLFLVPLTSNVLRAGRFSGQGWSELRQKALGLIHNVYQLSACILHQVCYWLCSLMIYIWICSRFCQIAK